jgi:hypothetical protein
VVNPQLHEAPVVVAMTTLPSRIGLMEPTLRSLRAQTRVPDQVLLALPERSRREGVGYRLPDFLRPGGGWDDLVQVVAAEQDFGPGTKLLGCLPAIAQPSIVLLADDDVRYHPRFVEDLVEAQVDDERGAFSYYTYRARGLTVGQGCDGFTMWSPRLRGLRTWVASHLDDPAVFHQDDVWISFFLARAGVRVRQVPLSEEMEGLAYEQVYELNPLQHLTGDLERHSVNRRAVDRLMRLGEPTVAMRAGWHLARMADGVGMPRAVRVARRVTRRVRLSPAG